MAECAHCGRPFDPKTPRGRYCHVNCRTAAHRARVAAGQAAPGVVHIAPDAEPVSGGKVYAATLAELQEAEREHTVAGQAALALAARVDLNRDTGSALAAAVKQLQTTLASALAGAEGTSVSRLEQMRARRDQKRA